MRLSFHFGHCLICVLACVLACGCSREAVDAGRGEVLGSLGRQPGQFSKPRAVAVTKKGELVAIDRTGRVQVFDLGRREFVRQWRLPDYSNGTPTGMSTDPGDDTVWIADTHYHRILQYNTTGELLFQFGERGEGPGQFVFPTDVTPDPEGKTLWVTDYGRRNRLMQFTRTGGFLREWGEDLYENADLSRPMAVAFSGDGKELLVADAGNHRVNVYNPEGQLLRTIGGSGTAAGQLKFPYDLAVGAGGEIFVMEYGNSRVSRFAADGTFRGLWGEAGPGKGELAAPWGCAISPDGVLVVADTNNQRLQIVENIEGDFKIPAAELAKAGGAGDSAE